MPSSLRVVSFLLLPLLGAASVVARQQSAAEQLRAAIAADRPYVLVHHDVFDALGWDLPDGGDSVTGFF